MSWEPPTIDPQAVKFYTFAGSRQIDAQYIYIDYIYIYIEETILTRMTSWFQIVSAVLWVHKLADPQ